MVQKPLEQSECFKQNALGFFKLRDEEELKITPNH